MRRFAIFATVLFVLVVIGSQPRADAGTNKRSFCVCVASRASLILRSMTGTATEAKAQASSGGRSADRALTAE